VSERELQRLTEVTPQIERPTAKTFFPRLRDPGRFHSPARAAIDQYSLIFVCCIDFRPAVARFQETFDLKILIWKPTERRFAPAMRMTMSDATLTAPRPPPLAS